MRRVWKALPLAVGAALTACAAVPPVVQLGSLALSGMSYVVTGKGPSDHVLSAVAEQDCALLRVIRSEPVCVSPSPDAGNRPTVASHPPAPAHARAVTTPRRVVAVPRSPSVYLVLGSFSKRTNATAWQTTLHPLATRLVTAQNGSGQRTFRVVTGPVPAATIALRLTELRRIGLDPWRLALCPQTLRRPPCENTMVAER